MGRLGVRESKTHRVGGGATCESASPIFTVLADDWPAAAIPAPLCPRAVVERGLAAERVECDGDDRRLDARAAIHDERHVFRHSGLCERSLEFARLLVGAAGLNERSEGHVERARDVAVLDPVVRLEPGPFKASLGPRVEQGKLLAREVCFDFFERADEFISTYRRERNACLRRLGLGKRRATGFVRVRLKPSRDGHTHLDPIPSLDPRGQSAVQHGAAFVPIDAQHPPEAVQEGEKQLRHSDR